MFESIQIIGQIDKKFIAILEQTKNLLILLDQHAVHERIRVERFLKGIICTLCPFILIFTHCFRIPGNQNGLRTKTNNFFAFQ